MLRLKLNHVSKRGYRLMPHKTFYGKSTLFEVMAWRSQWRARSISPYDVTTLQWVDPFLYEPYIYGGLHQEIIGTPCASTEGWIWNLMLEYTDCAYTNFVYTFRMWINKDAPIVRFTGGDANTMNMSIQTFFSTTLLSEIRMDFTDCYLKSRLALADCYENWTS